MVDLRFQVLVNKLVVDVRQQTKLLQTTRAPRRGSALSNGGGGAARARYLDDACNDFPQHPALADTVTQRGSDYQLGQDLANQRPETAVLEVLSGQQHRKYSLNEQLSPYFLVSLLLDDGIRIRFAWHRRQSWVRVQGVIDLTWGARQRRRVDGSMGGAER